MSRPAWRAVLLTLFPGMFPGPLAEGCTGSALRREIWSLEAMDMRRFSGNRHGAVDDTPFGGGPGMVLRPDVVAAAVDAALRRNGPLPVIALSPRGRPLDQGRIRRLAEGEGGIFLCGRYEGIDQRALDARRMEEICVSDIVLTGGELPAMMILDAVTRLLPGTLGNAESLEEESFSAGLLEHPQYTRPAEWEGRSVPEPLRSGHHGRIRSWRTDMAERATRERRPDLWAARELRQKAQALESGA